MLCHYHATDTVATCFCLVMVHDEAAMTDTIPSNLEALLDSKSQGLLPS